VIDWQLCGNQFVKVGTFKEPAAVLSISGLTVSGGLKAEIQLQAKNSR
jgi:hypothetical protein